MKRNKKDADRSAHADDDLVVEPQTLRRLDSIQKADESCDDVLTRLLDSAVEEVPIKDILTELFSRFDDAVSIDVDASPQHENPSMLIITVHTGEAEFEEQVTLIEGRESRAVIESQTGEQFCLPFDVIATCDGPKRETIGTTPVYVNDSVRGLEPVSLEEGADQLRTKIGKSSDELRELVHDR